MGKQTYFIQFALFLLVLKYKELRDKKSDIDEDIENVCTICSLDRNTFEKNSKGFEYHLTVEHNPFNYIFYMYTLKMKFETEYSGMDRYCIKMLNK